MSRKVIHLSGQQAEYDLRMIQTDSGPIAVLVGIAGPVAGETHYLTAIEAVEFADNRIELAETVLADSHKTDNRAQRVDTAENSQSDDTPTSDSSISDTKPTATHKSSQTNVAPSHYSQAAENKIEDELKVSREKPSETNTKSNDNNPQQNKPQAASDANSISSPTQQAPRVNSDTGSAGAADPSINSASRSNSAASSTTTEPNLIEGTSLADRLVGTSSDDRIDGLRNSESSSAFFHEELLAGDGNDMLFYRGFFGDINSQQSIQATLQGQAGNDTLDIVLDRTTFVTVDGGDGINHLTLQAPEAPFSPWQPGLLEWSWVGTSTAPTLQGIYTSALQSDAGVAEAGATFQTISAGNSTPLNIVRPDSLVSNNLVGSAQADFLLASAQTQEIHAGAGNDTILAREGNVIDAGAGINSVFAYSSDVTISYAESAYAVNLSLANKIGMVFDDSSNIYAVDRLMSPIQHATGSAQSDTLKGNDLDNTLRTHGGSDTLEGGAGADTFIIDLDTSNSHASIYDFNIDESDQLLINLNQWTPSSGETSFNQYQVVGDDHQVWWSGSLSQEEGALLTVLISQDNQNIQIGHEGQLQTAVTFDHAIDHWTTEDWTTALHIDYM
jgi:Ca2+-binding RTX toxin-like protein